MTTHYLTDLPSQPTFVDATAKYAFRPSDNGGAENTVTNAEIEWMLSKADRYAMEPVTSESAKSAVMERLVLDFGEPAAKQMTDALQALEAPHLLPCFLWPGVGTRVKDFATFLGSDPEKLKTAFTTPKDAFVAFAHHLGRRTTFRALALTPQQYQNILDADEIFPTGQLHLGDPKKVASIIDTHGVRKVLVARLFIAHLRKMIGYDPSISLHDEWQTTAIISSGYLGGGAQSEQNPSEKKSTYLFQVSVPVIEHCGITLVDVARHARPFLGDRYASHEPWFCFKAACVPQGCWFDATILRTERYGLYSCPFLQQRLMRVWRFETLESIADAVKPFVDQQALFHSRTFPQGENPC